MIPNVFDSNLFSMASLTAAINRLPNNYGRLGQLGLFPFKGVPTRTVVVDERNGVLALLPTKPVGAPGTVSKKATRKARSFAIPHIPHDGVIKAEDVQGVRKFGSENEAEGVVEVVNDQLQQMLNAHAITWEFMRIGAVKGEIVDCDLSPIYNLYDEFGIAKKTVYFGLAVEATNVAAKCREIVRHVEDNLKGDVSNGVRAVVSRAFFDALIAHPNVEKFYLNHSAALNLAGNGADPRKGFAFEGVIFEEYNANAADPDGNLRKFIADGQGHAFPTGTMSSFSWLGAPADFMEAVNTNGLPVYAKQEPMKHNRGVDLHTQSNPLFMCWRPEILVTLDAGAGA